MTDIETETLRVLVADDTHDIRILLSRLIRATRDLILLDPAKSGEEALDLALAGEADVVVMDACMPGIGGIEATRRLCARMPGCRVVGYSLNDCETLMLDAGASAFVRKGAPLEQLLAAIRGS